MFKIKMLVLLWASCISANSIQDIYSITAEKIIESAIIDSTAYKRLAYICDTFGPRLSGSTNLEKTITWILKEMKKDADEKLKKKYGDSSEESESESESEKEEVAVPVYNN